MKLKSYLLVGMAALTLAACDEDFKDWADPQGYDPDATMSIKNFSASGVSASNLMTTTGNIPVASYTAPAGTDSATMVYQVKLFDGKGQTQTVTLDSKGYANRDSLNAAILAMYGKNLVERDMKALVYAYSEFNGQAIYGRSDTITVKATPYAPYYIDASYNLVLGDETIALKHNDANNVYDDPVFTATIHTTAANTPWEVFSGTDNSINIGPATDAETSLTGSLVQKTGHKGVIPAAGWYTVSLNLYTYTYTIEALKISPYLWTPGNHQGWDPASSAKLYSANLDMIYTGYLYLNGEFKFTSSADWSHTNYGWADDNFDLSTTGGNLWAAEGFYYASVNTLKLNYSLTKIETFTIIGGATGDSSWGTDLAMTYDATNHTYTYTGPLVAGEFKFRANKGWSLNLGGTFGSLKQDGSNLKIDADGNYTIVLTPTYDGDSHCTVTKN
jgi:hypothetical protein